MVIGAGSDPHEVWLCQLVGSSFAKAVESGSPNCGLLNYLYLINIIVGHVKRGRGIWAPKVSVFLR